MEYLRFMIDFAIPMSDDPENKKTKKQRVLEANPELVDHYDTIIKMLRKMRKYSKIINEGLNNEERPHGKHHICRHELGLPCIDEEEIPPEK
ncbi:hypothetical protein DRN69_04495 [Candidatus Pacearchaeota archaeon]|nr:MAG: hypothetical protein DRN69_04495 [Candidatus Pacearchaeota archaeon]